MPSTTSLIAPHLLHCPCTCRTLACAARNPPSCFRAVIFTPTSWTAGSRAKGGEVGEQLARGRGSSDVAIPATRWCWQPTGLANPCHESSDSCKPAASGVGGLHRGGHAGGDVAAAASYHPPALLQPGRLPGERGRGGAAPVADRCRHDGRRFHAQQVSLAVCWFCLPPARPTAGRRRT